MRQLRNHYKESDGVRGMNKRGQIALFILIAIVIVGVFLWLVVRPRLPASLGGAEINPSAYLRDCLRSELPPVVATLSAQGGSTTPDNYVLFESTRVQYLCYTSEDYKPCIVQQPLLVRHVGDEIEQVIEPKARACMDTLVARYERQGYTVQSAPRTINVSIVPGSIDVIYTAPLTVAKESSQTFRQFTIKHPSELYDLLMTSTSIIEFESTLGDSETTYYMQFYPDLKIEKLKKDDDTIYTLTNVVTNDRFRFATRSLVWPRGYGESA